MPKFFGIGVGPGDPELMSLKALRIIESCPVIATPRTRQGSNLALDIVSQVSDLSDKEILKLDFAMSKDRNLITKHHMQAAEAVIAVLKSGRDLAFLNLGDVSMYATFHYLKPLIEESGFECVMIPGLPTFSAIAARLGVNLTPDMNTPLHIIPAASENLDEVLMLPGTKIIMKSGKNFPKAKEALTRLNLLDKALLVSDCGLETERVYRNLNEINENLSYFSTMVVLP